MNILVACDKFKGSLSAMEGVRRLPPGFRMNIPSLSVPLPTVAKASSEALLAVSSGQLVKAPCHDALGRNIHANYALINNSEAVIEMSAASGMWRISQEERNIMESNTFGTGELIRHAVEVSHARKIYIGIGGSATNDGGLGMAHALGAIFRDQNGQPVSPTPSRLHSIASLDTSGMIPLPSITVACDVTNPLLGPQGASTIFGPQKGASESEQQLLEEALTHLLQLTQAADLAELPGAGAAGGLGFGLKYFCDAEMVPGFDLIADAIGLPEKIAQADLVITGEGSLDGQTLDGKGPAGVAALARECGKTCYAIGGQVTAEAAALFDKSYCLTSLDLPLETLIAKAAPLLEKLVREKVEL